jgi:hypothetical protein
VRRGRGDKTIDRLCKHAGLHRLLQPRVTGASSSSWREWKALPASSATSRGSMVAVHRVGA